MDDRQATPESVMEFLGSITLLQWLPRSSLKTISEVIEFKNFDNGEYLVHKGEAGKGVYFIWKGEVEVLSPINSKALRHRELLRRGDYFGCVSVKESHRADVIALSKVICLALSHEHRDLISAESIWNAEHKMGSYPKVEDILQVENLEVDKFRGITLPGAPAYGPVFGGQLISQVNHTSPYIILGSQDWLVASDLGLFGDLESEWDSYILMLRGSGISLRN